MTDVKTVKGSIEITNDTWIWSPRSLEKQNINQLKKDMEFIDKVNPASGVTFRRHLYGAEGCEQYLNNIDEHAKCIISKKKAGLI